MAPIPRAKSAVRHTVYHTGNALWAPTAEEREKLHQYALFPSTRPPPPPPSAAGGRARASPANTRLLVPSRPRPPVTETERRLRDGGWAVLSTMDVAEAEEWGRALDVLAQRHIMEWQPASEGEVHLCAARPSPDFQAQRQADLLAARQKLQEGGCSRDALLLDYHRLHGWAFIKHPDLGRLVWDIRHPGGMDVYCESLDVDAEVWAVRFEEPTLHGGRGELQDGWGVLVTSDLNVAENTRQTLRRLQDKGVPLSWNEDVNGEEVTIKAKAEWPEDDDEVRIQVVGEEDDNRARFATCHGLKDLEKSDLDISWHLSDNGVVTVGPWAAF